MILLFVIFLLVLLMVTAFGIAGARNLFAAVMLTGMFSLQMALVFFLLDAADVALTEAAVGAGVATVLLLGALGLVEDHEIGSHPRRRWAMVVVVTAAAIIAFAAYEMPHLGDPNAPVHQVVAPWYLENTPELIDIPNVVTAILASFRGYDTLGELFVILTAGLGVRFLFTLPGTEAARSPRHSLGYHVVPRVVARVLVPFIVLFGLYVQFHGEYGPGGGFQAGVLVAVGIILHALVEGERFALRLVPPWLQTLLVVVGAVLYLATGLVGMVLGGNFLDYSVLGGGNPVAGQHLGILLVELGIGMTVTGVMLTIFHAFAARRPHP